MAWKGFKAWLDKFHQDKKIFVKDISEEIQSLHENMCQKEFENIKQSPVFYFFADLFDVYLDFLRYDNGPLSTF